MSRHVMAGERAAAYLSSYFVRGKGEKATLSENARNPHLPRMLIWLTPKGDEGDGDHDAQPASLSAALGGPAWIARSP